MKGWGGLLSPGRNCWLLGMLVPPLAVVRGGLLVEQVIAWRLLEIAG